MTTNNKALKVFIEGVDGTGKTTLAKKAVQKLNELVSEYDFHYLREPGGSERAEEIRQKIMQGNITKEEEIELFAKAREYMYEDNKELLEDPKNVIIFDRSVLSSVVYQTEELTKEEVLKVIEANRDFLGMFGFYDLGVLLEVVSSSEEKQRKVFERTMNDGREQNRLDPDFDDFKKLSDKYLKVFMGIKLFSSGTVLNAGNSIEENTFFLVESVMELLEEKGFNKTSEEIAELEKMADDVFFSETLTTEKEEDDTK